MNVVDKIEKENLERLRKDKNLPEFSSGDKVRVHIKIIEGDKTRIQIFEGIVIRKKRGSVRSSFVIRKVSFGIGVERIFPLYSPNIEKIELVERGKVRRSRIYYLRKLRGKAARIKKLEYRS
ncbi:MAG: 50S ribosomal protein L19 [Thermodesulfobacteriota bacterium]|nr:50S ribosomal protein L19 [Thermodesulfobacteriota bacterium]